MSSVQKEKKKNKQKAKKKTKETLCDESNLVRISVGVSADALLGCGSGRCEALGGCSLIGTLGNSIPHNSSAPGNNASTVDGALMRPGGSAG